MLGLGVAGVRVRVWGQFRTGSTEPRFALRGLNGLQYRGLRWGLGGQRRAIV